jgi:hypothetical protein
VLVAGRRTSITRARALLVVACLTAPALVRAHEIAVEQRVDMAMQPAGDRLVVRLTVPATVLGDAQLPRLADGWLNPSAIDAPIQLVAADTARNLDLRVGGSTAPSPTASARLGADRMSVEIELTYTIGENAAGVSARLNAFASTPLRPVRTTVRYLPRSGSPRTISVTGPPTRVLFNPTVSDTFRQFAARALAVVVSGGDHLLFLACLLLPLRGARDAVRPFAAMISGQAAAIVFVALWPAIGAAWAPLAAVLAGSAIVVAALQNIVGARLVLVGVLAAGFGVMSGVGNFGASFAAAQEVSGAHRTTALAVFLVVAAAAQLWLAAVMWATRKWLDGLGLPNRFSTVLASVLLAHVAMHAVVDRGQHVTQVGAAGSEYALVWIVLAWATVMVVIASIEAARGRRIA